jgi:hypothetical protein
MAFIQVAPIGMSTILTCSIVGIPNWDVMVIGSLVSQRIFDFEMHPPKCIAWFPFALCFAFLFFSCWIYTPFLEMTLGFYMFHLSFFFTSSPPLFFKGFGQRRSPCKDVPKVTM